jgi:opacity protein-like surface antigen
MKPHSRIAFVMAAVSLWPCLSYAQHSSSVSQGVELSYLLGVSQPSVVVEEPAAAVRTPPSVVEPGDSLAVITQDVTVRFWWTRRMSTIVDGGWSTEGSREYSFPRPASASPFSTYESQRTVSYHNRLLSVSQAWDLRASGRVVPYVGGGVELRSAVRRQDSRYVSLADPSLRSSSSTERSGLQVAALATAGVRVLISGHLSFLVDGMLFSGDRESGVVPNGGVFFSNTPDTLLGRIAGRWRAGVGIRF